MLNAFYGKKKILVVNIGGNQLAKEIVSALKQAGCNGVVELEAPQTYAGYYAVAQQQPDYTIFVKDGSICKVQPCRVQGYAGDRLGNFVSRDLHQSQRAKECYRHPLKMLGLKPQLLGAYEIPFEDVKDKETAWFWQDNRPLLFLTLPPVEGVAQAVCEAVQNYWKGGE